MAMWMQVVIIPFLVAFICVWLIHPAIAKMAIVRGLTDNPNARKLQKTPVPVMGGMAVFFGIIVSAGVTSIVFNSYALFTCVVTMTVMMYMGFIDDLVGIKPWIRIAIEVAVIGFVVIMDLVNINDFHGLFGIGKLPVYVSLPLCAFSGVGIINAINMIDGVDGLSSGLGIFISFVFGCVFFYSHDFTMAVMAFATMGALVPFFFKNVFGHLSKMFIGDSGTMMMGIILCIFCMRTIDNTSRVSRAYPNLGVIAFCLAALSIPGLRHRAGHAAAHLSWRFSFRCRQDPSAPRFHPVRILPHRHDRVHHHPGVHQRSILFSELLARSQRDGAVHHCRSDEFHHNCWHLLLPLLSRQDPSYLQSDKDREPLQPAFRST